MEISNETTNLKVAIVPDCFLDSRVIIARSLYVNHLQSLYFAGTDKKVSVLSFFLNLFTSGSAILPVNNTALEIRLTDDFAMTRSHMQEKPFVVL